MAKLDKDSRKLSKQLFQASFTSGQLDAAKVRAIAAKVGDTKPRNFVGVLKDYQTTRELAGRIQKLTGVARSHGCSFADSWRSVQFQRMPNISLLPGEQDIGVDQIVARGTPFRDQRQVAAITKNRKLPARNADLPDAPAVRRDAKQPLHV